MSVLVNAVFWNFISSHSPKSFPHEMWPTLQWELIAGGSGCLSQPALGPAGMAQEPFFGMWPMFRGVLEVVYLVVQLELW